MISKTSQFHSFTVSQNGMGGGVRTGTKGTREQGNKKPRDRGKKGTREQGSEEDRGRGSSERLTAEGGLGERSWSEYAPKGRNDRQTSGKKIRRGIREMREGEVLALLDMENARRNQAAVELKRMGAGAP